MHKQIWVAVLLFLLACSQQEKDKGIRQMIATEAREQVAFAAVGYKVVDGVVTLQGACATEQERLEVESMVQQTAGVKAVQNNIAVAPVVLTGAHLLKKAVDSVLMDYPAVLASIRDSVIYLEGKVPEKTAEKLQAALQGLGAIGICNNLTLSTK